MQAFCLQGLFVSSPFQTGMVTPSQDGGTTAPGCSTLTRPTSTAIAWATLATPTAMTILSPTWMTTATWWPTPARPTATVMGSGMPVTRTPSAGASERRASGGGYRDADVSQRFCPSPQTRSCISHFDRNL